MHSVKDSDEVLHNIWQSANEDIYLSLVEFEKSLAVKKLYEETTNRSKHESQNEEHTNLKTDYKSDASSPKVGQNKMSKKLPFGKFLPTKQVIDILLDNKSECAPCIPVGIKEDVYIVVDNSNNAKRAEAKLPKMFHDDCGAWVKFSNWTCLYLKTSNSGYKEIRMDSSKKYCIRNPRTGTCTPIEPQPAEENIVTVSRYYCKLKADQEFTRRISWCPKATSSIALVEYKGKFPGHLKHGNSGYSENAYIRTSKETMEKIDAAVSTTSSSRNLYDEMQESSTDLLQEPRNLKQLYNKKCNVKRHKSGSDISGKKVYDQTFADELLELISMTQTHPFVQKIFHGKSSPPSIILFSDNQITDVKRFCLSGLTVLGVDKTYNLGRIFATILTFKNLSVTNNQSYEHPLFLGPIFLHSTSDFQTFSLFFSYLSSILPNHNNLIIGSDDEKGLIKAITTAFPDSNHILCTKALKQNLTDFMQHKIGIQQAVRKSIVNQVFAIAECADRTEFEVACSNVTKKWEKSFPALTAYLNSRMFPLIRDKVWQMRPNFAIGNRWTNNNSESVNRILKLKTEWKLKKLPALIDLIYQLVMSHYADVEKALLNIGPYCLSKRYQHFKLSAKAYYEKSKIERDSHFREFMKYKPIQLIPGISTNCKLITVIPSKSAGKKIGQKRKCRAESTGSLKRLAVVDE